MPPRPGYHAARVVESIAVKVVGAFVAVIVLLLALPKLFGREARLRRKLRKAQQRAIRELAESSKGPRRIAGMVVAIDEPLIAPLSGRPCVFYETRVVRAIGWGVDRWDIEYRVAFEKRSQAFLVDDGTGTALVDPARAEMLLGMDVDRWSFNDDADPVRENAFLARFKQRRRGLLFEKRLHFTESIIEVGERIAVAGTARHEQDPAAVGGDPYRHQVDTTPPHLSGTPRFPVLISDDPVFAPPLEDSAEREAPTAHT
jgi:hypothetical protein